MYKTIDLLNQVKAAYDLQSDYALAKKMGISKQRVHKYMKSGAILDDQATFIVAELLSLNPAQLVACMNFERAHKAHDAEKVKFWEQFLLAA